MASSPPDINPTDKDGQQRRQKDSEIRVEVAVNIDKQDDLAKIEQALKSQQGVKLLSSDLESKTILLRLDGQNDETNGSEQIKDVGSLQRFVEKQTGFTAVVKGLGNLFSAVAELRPPSSSSSSPVGEQVIGVVRLSQLANQHCFVDGAVDGFELDSNRRRNRHWSVAVHEFGDLEGKEFESIGNPLVKLDCSPVASVSKDFVEKEGKLSHRMAFRKIIPKCDVASMIGRSVAVTEGLDFDGNCKLSGSGKILSAGVVARASTIGSNEKQFCSCSGKTIWQERIERQQGERD